MMNVSILRLFISLKYIGDAAVREQWVQQINLPFPLYCTA